MFNYRKLFGINSPSVLPEARGLQTVMFSNCPNLDKILGEEYNKLPLETLPSPPNAAPRLQIEWPGYPLWERELDEFVGKDEITNHELAKTVAEALRDFIEAMGSKSIDKANTRWKVGPGGIQLEHLRLDSSVRHLEDHWQLGLSYQLDDSSALLYSPKLSVVWKSVEIFDISELMGLEEVKL